LIKKTCNEQVPSVPFVAMHFSWRFIAEGLFFVPADGTGAAFFHKDE
jgi:hypothetical protein